MKFSEHWLRTFVDPALATRESVAIKPSGLPVLNVKESAAAGIAMRIATLTVAMQLMIRRLFMGLLRNFSFDFPARAIGAIRYTSPVVS